MPSIDLSAPDFRYDPADPEGMRSGMVRPGPELGARRTGVSIYELPPGQVVCPYHFECGEEEWAMPLDGTLTLRDPDGERQLPPMHLAFFPPGPGGAHQLRNDGEASVRLLMFGERGALAATVYPDSDKVGIWAGEGADGLLFERSAAVDYYHGEG
jgi:uncharacterized cupin superfamily protein